MPPNTSPLFACNGRLVEQLLVGKMSQFIMKHNLNPLRYQTYDAVRIYLGKNGYMPLFMTEREKLADLIEGANLNDRSVRQSINQRHQEILDSEPALIPHK